jgi:uncharacterized protein with PIN domain
VTVVVRHRCRDRREAETLRAAVAADNPSYVTVAAEGHELIVRLTAPSATSARTTLEDLLACLKAAERTVGVAGSS